MRKQQSVTDQRRLDLAAPAKPAPAPAVPDEGESEPEEDDETQDLVAVLGGLSNEQYPD